MPFYAPGGLKKYIQDLLQEGQEFEESLPENYPRNLVSLEEVKVVYNVIQKRCREVGHLHAYLAQIEVAHRECRNIVSLTEWMIAIKNIRFVEGYLNKLRFWLRQLDEMKESM